MNRPHGPTARIIRSAASRPLRRLLGTLVVGLLLLVATGWGLSGARATAGPAFTANIELTRNPPPTGLNGTDDAEPSIRVSAQNHTYVTAPQGLPAGCDFWQVAADGASAAYTGKSDAGAGGGDCEIATSPSPVGAPLGQGKDVIAASSLTLGNVTTTDSYDGGTTWHGPNPAGQGITGVDRQWNAAGGRTLDTLTGQPDFYMTYRQVPSSQIFVARSTDGGLSYQQTGPPVNTPVLSSSSCCVAIGGNMAVDPSTGTDLYVIFASLAPSGGGGPFGAVYLAASHNGGMSWTDSVIHDGSTQGQSYDNTFPVIAMDAGGTLYAAYSDGADVHLATPGAGGVSQPWTDQVVPTLNGTRTNVFPWIAGGAAGQADVVWYGTTDATSGCCANGAGTGSSQWNVYFARFTNGAAPVLSQVSDHVIHTGRICVDNTNCGASNPRTLLDFFQVADGPDGVAHVAWADDHRSPGTASVFYAQSLPVIQPPPPATPPPTPTPTPTATPTPASTPTPSPTPTPTPAPTPTPTPTPTSTPTPTPAPTPTPTPCPRRKPCR